MKQFPRVFLGLALGQAVLVFVVFLAAGLVATGALQGGVKKRSEGALPP